MTGGMIYRPNDILAEFDIFPFLQNMVDIENVVVQFNRQFCNLPFINRIREMARSAARNSLSASGFSDNRLRTLAAPALPITLEVRP